MNNRPELTTQLTYNDQWLTTGTRELIARMINQYPWKTKKKIANRIDSKKSYKGAIKYHFGPNMIDEFIKEERHNYKREERINIIRKINELGPITMDTN